MATNIPVILYGVPFSQPVRVNASFGEPTLALALDTGTRHAALAASQTQYVDVGVHASEPVTAGAYRLTWGNQTTGCIEWDSGYSTGAAHSDVSMWPSATSKVSEVPHVKSP